GGPGGHEALDCHRRYRRPGTRRSRPNDVSAANDRPGYGGDDRGTSGCVAGPLSRLYTASDGGDDASPGHRYGRSKRAGQRSCAIYARDPRQTHGTQSIERRSSMFLFEQMFNTALNGILSAGMMSAILTVAYGMLLTSLLFSAYEAWTKGGDVRALGIAALKYLALGLLFGNGGAIYDSIFRSVVGSFDQLAHAMAGAGPGDVFAAWLTEIRNTTLNSTTLLNVITGAFAGMLSAALLLIAMVLYPVAYTIFAVLYSLFGTI